MYMNSDRGRIGPFWWINASNSPLELRDTLYAGSVCNVWLKGTCGFGPLVRPAFVLELIR